MCIIGLTPFFTAGLFLHGNDILPQYIMSLKWQISEISSGTAANCVSKLRDALWYIDGLHDTLNERSCKIPEVFSQFIRYSKPESQ